MTLLDYLLCFVPEAMKGNNSQRKKVHYQHKTYRIIKVPQLPSLMEIYINLEWNSSHLNIHATFLICDIAIVVVKVYHVL